MHRFCPITRIAGGAASRLALVASLVAALLAAGCDSGPPDVAPSPGLGDPYPAPFNDPQISVLSPELRPWIAFHPAIITRDRRPPRPMQVEVPVRNVTDRQYVLDYRFIFYDESGREQEPVMGWALQALDPKQVVRLKAGALDAEARDYRLEVRWAR